MPASHLIFLQLIPPLLVTCDYADSNNTYITVIDSLPAFRYMFYIFFTNDWLYYVEEIVLIINLSQIFNVRIMPAVSGELNFS